MNRESEPSTTDEDPSPAEFAEAAAWVARLHGPNRTLSIERGFGRWLRAKSAHAAAFEAMTAAWEVAGKLRREPFPRLSRWERAGYREGFIRSVIAVASIALVVFGASFVSNATAGVVTGIGEQRILILDDGSRITLNTDTRITVDFDEQERMIALKRGEAVFEVAKNPTWPFVVKVGDSQVSALGTEFVVRRDEDAVAITLMEGRVAVARRNVPEARIRKAALAYLAPGQRLTIAAGRPPRIDLPDIDKVTAWRHGLLDFENMPLSEAIVEMNRYSVIKLVVNDPACGCDPCYRCISRGRCCEHGRGAGTPL